MTSNGDRQEKRLRPNCLNTRIEIPLLRAQPSHAPCKEQPPMAASFHSAYRIEPEIDDFIKRLIEARDHNQPADPSF